jgi:protein O-mannosyl-transferase
LETDRRLEYIDTNTVVLARFCNISVNSMNNREDNSRSFWTTAAAAVLLVVAVLVVYAPVMKGNFIWDDDTHVTKNVLTKPNGLYLSWFTTEQHNYWPVTWTALWFQWQRWGMDPHGYHVVTILLHAACCLALWRLLRQLDVPGAWLAALIFAVHPVNVETGAWITQQKNLLSMFFGIVSVDMALRSMKTASGMRYAFALLMFLISLLAKTATVTMPVAILGCIWWQNRTLRPRDFLATAPFFALSAALSLNEIWFQYHRAMASDVRADSLVSRFVTAGHAILFYASKIVFPYNLNFVYQNPSINVHSDVSWMPVVIIGMVFLLALWKRDGWGRPVLFGLGYYVVTLLPVVGFLNIYFMRYSWASDHWQYTAEIGLIALIIGVLWHASARASMGVRVFAAGAALLAVGFLGSQSFERSKLFRDNEALWPDTIARNPDAWMARNNYAEMLIEEGRLDEAIEQLNRAIASNPHSMAARLNLAKALTLQGRIENADRCLETALRVAPGSADAHYEWGRLLLMTGALDRAKLHFDAALKRRPSLIGAYVGLGMIENHNGRPDAALRFMAQALRLDPENADAWHAAAEIMFERGKLEQALRWYKKTAEINLRYPDIHNDLGIVCADLGKLDLAIQHFQQALKLVPSDVKARSNLQKAMDERNAKH